MVIDRLTCYVPHTRSRKSDSARECAEPNYLHARGKDEGACFLDVFTPIHILPHGILKENVIETYL